MEGLIEFVFIVSFCSITKEVNCENAQWIWQNGYFPSNVWVSFRKTITLDEIPKVVEAQIAAYSKFWLWINGEMVFFGGGLSTVSSPLGKWDRKNISDKTH